MGTIKNKEQLIELIVKTIALYSSNCDYHELYTLTNKISGKRHYLDKDFKLTVPFEIVLKDLDNNSVQ